MTVLTILLADHTVCLGFDTPGSVLEPRPTAPWFVTASRPVPERRTIDAEGRERLVRCAGGCEETRRQEVDSSGCAHFTLDAGERWTFRVLGDAPALTFAAGELPDHGVTRFVVPRRGDLRPAVRHDDTALACVLTVR